MLNNNKSKFNDVMFEVFDWGKYIGKALLCYIAIVILLSFLLFVSRFGAPASDYEDVNCEVQAKYTKFNKYNLFDKTDYFIRLTSDNVTGEYEVNEKVYDSVGVGDVAEACAKYYSDGELMEFVDVKFISSK